MAPVVRFSNAELALLQGWPLHLIQDAGRQAETIASAEDFLAELLHGEHLDRVFVLRNGTNALDLRMEDTLPRDVLEALQVPAEKPTAAFLANLAGNADMLAKYKAGLEYAALEDGAWFQRSTPPRRGKIPGVLEKRLSHLRYPDRSSSVPLDSVYVTELRYQQKRSHALRKDELVKSACRRGLKDVLGTLADWTFFWQRKDEGVFVGAAPSGKAIHVDQVRWSNVGRNWQGYKLFITWPAGQETEGVLGEFSRVVLRPPLSEAQLRLLERASTIALIRPGDVYAFNGAVAHTVLNLSSELSVSAYESFVPLLPRHVEQFMCCPDTNQDDEWFDDLKESVAKHLNALAGRIGQGLKAEASEPLVSMTWQKLQATLLVPGSSLRDDLLHGFARSVAIARRDPVMRSALSEEATRAARRIRMLAAM